MELYKTNKHLCRRPKDDFSDFRPFVQKLSGVLRMGVLVKGDKRVYLIGEHHQTNFCRHLGYTPIAEVVEDFLFGGDHVDLMVEMDTTRLPRYDHERLRQLVRSEKNVARYTDLGHSTEVVKSDTLVSVINLTRGIVHPYLKKEEGYTELPKGRVHWLEPNITENTAWDYTSGTTLQYWFHEFVDLMSSKLSLIYEGVEEDLVEIQQKMDNAMNKINDIIQKNTTHQPPLFTVVRKGPGAARHYYQMFKASTREDKLRFLDICIDKLFASKKFDSCKRQFRFFDHYVYREAFWAFWSRHNKKTMEEFYYYVQRFFMDVYTCCRIMKVDKVWFKKIVIYAGAFHTENYIRLLKASGFTYHQVPNMQYNATCEDTE